MSSSALTHEAPIKRPDVATTPSRRVPILFGLALAVGAGSLFAVLETRRNQITAPATRIAPGSEAGMITAPPPLTIPDDLPAASPNNQTDVMPWSVPNQNLPGPQTPPATNPPAPYIPARTPRIPHDPAFVRADELPKGEIPSFSEPTPGVVYQAPPAQSAAERSSRNDAKETERVEASMFANPATTVPKGAIIQAVLETALDSNRAGPARAIISRDVRSFDGTKVLIPRGSRLYGEYKADLKAGQNRALIQWQRLMRPDGAVIELDSPSADPLGRAGVRGKVNTHFLERFGGAILQSTLDIGVALATRSVSNGTVIIGLPGGMLPQVAATPPDQVKPTLKVMQGTAVSVFVARDLDFTKVER